jgi:mRNA interferase RelE/StbE
LGYKIAIKPSAVKELAGLDNSTKRRIAGFIDRLKTLEDPRVSGIAMQGTGRLWRYRVGDYRIIADIEDKTITIEIIKIGHRSGVYK